jgi:hypothetical protein
MMCAGVDQAYPTPPHSREPACVGCDCIVFTIRFVRATRDRGDEGDQACVTFVASDCRVARDQRPGVLELLTLFQHRRS